MELPVFSLTVVVMNCAAGSADDGPMLYSERHCCWFRVSDLLAKYVIRLRGCSCLLYQVVTFICWGLSLSSFMIIRHRYWIRAYAKTFCSLTQYVTVDMAQASTVVTAEVSVRLSKETSKLTTGRCRRTLGSPVFGFCPSSEIDMSYSHCKNLDVTAETPTDTDCLCSTVA